MRRLIAILIAPFVISACGGSSTPTTPTPATVACTNIVLSSTSINQSAGGGATTISVTATPSNCTWTAVSNNAFLRVTSQATNTGNGSFTFTTDPNTLNDSRNGSITVGNSSIAVQQLGVAPPLVFNPTAPPNGVVGVAYSHSFAVATGGVPPITYSLDSGGFAPNGLLLASNGILAGTPTAPTIAPLSFGVCAVDGAGNRRCVQFTMSVSAAPTTTAADQLLGNWGGTITLNIGCLPPSELPQNFSWTGTFRTNSRGGVEILVSVPNAAVFSEVWPVTVSGRTVRIQIEFDSLYTFTATLSPDGNSLVDGTFVGGNCSVPPQELLPRGTWRGTRR